MQGLRTARDAGTVPRGAGPGPLPEGKGRSRGRAAVPKSIHGQNPFPGAGGRHGRPDTGESCQRRGLCRGEEAVNTSCDLETVCALPFPPPPHPASLPPHWRA